MAEYIEKSIAIAIVSDSADMYPFEKNESIRRIEDSTPTEVAPVVHGRWLPEHHKDKVSQTEYHSYIWYHCSECGRRLIGYRDPREAPFCHCGTKMDLRGENSNGSEKA